MQETFTVENFCSSKDKFRMTLEYSLKFASPSLSKFISEVLNSNFSVSDPMLDRFSDAVLDEYNNKKDKNVFKLLGVIDETKKRNGRKS